VKRVKKIKRRGLMDKNRLENGFESEAGAVQAAEKGDERREKRERATEKED
jgi:hypothetical protein